MRVSSASRAQSLGTQESQPQQLLLFLTETPPLATTVTSVCTEPANDTPSLIPTTLARPHLRVVPNSSPSTPAVDTLSPESSRQWLATWLRSEQEQGLPEKVARIWQSLVPCLVELSYYVINPEMTLAANIKQVRRIYEDTQKLRSHTHNPLPDLDIDENIMECIAVALGTLPHSQSETLVMSLVQGEPSSLRLATGAVARNEALHSLDVILTGVWNKRHRHWLTSAQLTQEVAHIMSYLYWEAGRSPLLDHIVLTQTDIERLERREREQYYSIFTDDNIEPFLNHIERNMNALREIRKHSAKRFSRFLMRDPRWTQPFSDQLAQLQTKYRDYLDFS